MLKENIEIFFFRNKNHIRKEDIKFESPKIHKSNFKMESYRKNLFRYFFCNRFVEGSNFLLRRAECST
ncbi:hypothetical protein DQM68_00560 [Leptospira mayottensis]|uniref:Uncharacterized protein n=1 Tax=Leptospira mayottensis TaxID=1137606 RepID=A0ABM6Y635_9LEPT|nr:hypothetical protein DQM68_00560 [Leptospira mayottensis]AXR63217.1 hypothetical protein DQM28_02185 [Leptospira mayottensis]AXR66975.1 hypothetical protein DPV73_02045 [Leptospira mayottensis]AZQ01250.1 hypothetical protein LEP1GSC190_03435 [Leptospira mayottensis 200901116]TGN18093.1 hypothetical protein EHR03_00250 [Leptospira mayottensis]